MAETDDKCSVCGITALELARPWGALITHQIRGRRRTITWTMCLSCELKELRAAS